MAYITTQDIIDRVGAKRAYELTTDTGTTPDQAVLEEVRKASEGDVNRRLKRYETPLDLTIDATLAETVKALTLDIAQYRLNLRRPPIADAFQKLYDSAIEWLAEANEGKAIWPGAVTPASQESDQPSVDWGSATPNASRETIV